jgi:hypothetical protein
MSLDVAWPRSTSSFAEEGTLLAPADRLVLQLEAFLDASAVEKPPSTRMRPRRRSPARCRPAP